MTKRRVVVTGIGIISPVGLTLKENWDNIVNGVSGISKIDRFDTEGFACKIAGGISNFEPSDWMPAKEARKMDREHVERNHEDHASGRTCHDHDGDVDRVIKRQRNCLERMNDER